MMINWSIYVIFNLFMKITFNLNIDVQHKCDVYDVYLGIYIYIQMIFWIIL